jgi:1-acyl-sn-glycerol-3-phosphate acyltransferase
MPSKTKVNRLYWFFHFIINIYMRTLCRLKVTGVENIPRTGGLIIASNHIAAADPFLLGSAVPRELWFMAKKELFQPPFLGWLLPKLNAYPVDRFGFDLDVIKVSIAFLQDGKALIMFPEGTRSKDGAIQEGKIGVGMLARKAGTPIVPVYLENTGKAWWNFIRGRRMIVSFGEKISEEWMAARPNGKDGYGEIARKVMQKIRELQGNQASKQY